MQGLFWVAVEEQPKYEYPLSWKLIYRKGSLVIGEDKKMDIEPFGCSATQM
jgi:hypothetical protein